MSRALTIALGAAGLAALLSGPAMAAEVKAIAILTPEQGTDYGWNQQGIEAAKAAGAKEGVKVMVAQNLGYGDVRPTMRELAEGGANLLIAHASGYNTAAPEIGAEEKVAVAIVDKPGTGRARQGCRLYAERPRRRLSGRPARRQDDPHRHGRHRRLGRASGSWNSQSAAFAEGAKAENPKINIRYAVIGPAAYSDAAGGKRVTDAVIAAGADIIFGQGNGSSFGMLQAVDTDKATDGGKVYFIDVIGDKSSLDKDHLLSSVALESRARLSLRHDRRPAASGKFGTYEYSIKLADDSVKLLKTSQIPDKIWSELQPIRDDIISGKIKVVPHFDAAAVHALVTDVAVAK